MVYLTAAGASLLGYAPEEMLGHHALDFLDANWRQPGASAMEDLRRGRPRRQEMCLVNRAGEAVWAEFSAAPSFASPARSLASRPGRSPSCAGWIRETTPGP